ncbi:MAG TPA: ArgE/DapE family deacylase [Vicinamibacterales bacterium]|nr:ArgE/DapE family deacylase [Vicinamibacterales bacterium]
MPDPCIELLEELVAIDSVNPSLVPGAAGEERIAAAVAERMRALQLEVHVEEVVPGRPNVVGVLDTGVPGPSLMFCGHLDTVGVEGMVAPFTPVVADGRLYGRGSQDMKGGVAAMIDAARLVREARPRRGRLLIAAVVDEEFASIGVDALVQRWTADAAVVTEPTDLQVAVAHKGFAWVEIETTGRAAHGSRPREGRDAIVRMGRVLARLELLDRELQARAPHPLLGTASLHASTVEGGREWSSYPDRCRLQMERRTVPGETDATALAEVQGVLAGLREEDAEFTAVARVVFSRPPYEAPPAHELVGLLRDCATRYACEVPTIGMSFWTDAAVLGAAGIPSVLFGPGGSGLHSTEEYVHVAEVITCRDVLADLAERWLARP